MFSFSKTIFKKELAALVLPFLLALSLPAQGSAKDYARGIVTAKTLHVRARPDKDSRSLMILSKGNDVNIIGHTDNGWLEVAKKSIKGFVRNRENYIRVMEKKQAEVKAGQRNAKADVVKKNATRAQKKKIIDSKIKKHQNEIQVFTEKETAIIKDLNVMDQRLNNSRQKVVSLKKDLALIDRNMKENSKEEASLHQAIKRNEGYVARRIVSLYKLGQLGRMNVIASADSVYELINRQRSLEFVLKEDEKILGVHLKNMSRLKDIEKGLGAQRKKTERLQNDLVQQLSFIENTKKRRSVLLSEIRQKKSVGLAAISSLKDAARELDKAIRSLDKGFAADEPDDDMILTPFTRKKGAMKMPVKGKIVGFFGTSTDNEFKVETFQSGIQVLADRGEPVQAVGAGQVLFSDWLKGYGNLIIIDHGKGFYSLYGHTEEVFKKKGDRVEDREVIATVGDTGSLSGPRLHFEIRHRGEPVDPLTWLKKGGG